MLICITFVFLALIELVIAIAWDKHEVRHSLSHKKNDVEPQDSIELNEVAINLILIQLFWYANYLMINIVNKL